MTAAALPGATIPLTRKQRARLRVKEAREVSAREAKHQAETKDEFLAPAAQRNAVVSQVTITGPDGKIRCDNVVLRESRLVRGRNAKGEPEAGFRRRNVVAELLARDRGRGHVTPEHEEAVKWLALAWDEVGGGLGLGASDYGSGGGKRATAPMQPPRHADLVAQLTRREQMLAAFGWLRGAGPMMIEVGLNGMPVQMWADRNAMSGDVAKGYLIAALDRLLEFYNALEHGTKLPAFPSTQKFVDTVQKHVSLIRHDGAVGPPVASK